VNGSLLLVLKLGISNLLVPHCKECRRPSGSISRTSWPSIPRGTTARIARSALCRLVRRQVRAVRVYRVPLLGVDARGFPGRRPHAGTPRSYLTGLFEAVIRLGAAGRVALAYPRRVRGCILRRVRFPYPYVPHLLPPFLVASFYVFGGWPLAFLTVLDRSRSSSKNRAISSQTSRPPLRPLQCIRMRPTSL
jgi:hypothetical protein